MLKILLSILLFVFNIQPGQELKDFISDEISTSQEQEQNQIYDNSETQQSETGDTTTTDAQNPSDSQESVPKDHPNTEKVIAYNNSSGKVIDGVAQVAIDKSPALEDCTSDQNICTPTPSPTPTPTFIPEPLPTIIPFPDTKPPKPIPTIIIHPPCNFEPGPGYNLLTPDIVDCMY